MLQEIIIFYSSMIILILHFLVPGKNNESKVRKHFAIIYFQLFSYLSHMDNTFLPIYYI